MSYWHTQALNVRTCHTNRYTYRALDAQQRHPYTVQRRKTSSAQGQPQEVVAPTTRKSIGTARKGVGRARMYELIEAMRCGQPLNSRLALPAPPRCFMLYRSKHGDFGDGTGSRQLARPTRLRLAVAAFKLRHGPVPLFLAREPAPAFCRDSNEAGTERIPLPAL